MQNIKDWYVANLGYIVQWSEPYFEVLTVRENLTLAAQLKLSDSFDRQEKFKMIEQALKAVKGHTYTCMQTTHAGTQHTQYVAHTCTHTHAHSTWHTHTHNSDWTGWAC